METRVRPGNLSFSRGTSIVINKDTIKLDITPYESAVLSVQGTALAAGMLIEDFINTTPEAVLRHVKIIKKEE